MDIPLVNVTARISDQQGRPVHRAQIVMRLTTVERYCGLIVPREARAETDPQGRAVLKVWPNELGTESSEYMVTVTFPETCQVSGGKHPSHLPPLHSLRYHATVPNSDCNLHDIAELPPYEQRGSGQVITSEVAAYAAEAGRHAAAAESTKEAVAAMETGLNGIADQADAAKGAAQEAARQAQGHERRAQEMTDGVADTISTFEHTVVDRTERTAARLTKDAITCITQYKADALQAIELRSGDVLNEISKTASDAQTNAVNTVAEAREHAVGDIDGARSSGLAALREEAALFGEDFENLTERALTAAKRAGCSSASAQDSATKACGCATRAEQASQGMERYRDDALAAAQRAESAGDCARADAQRAESAADSVGKNATIAKDAADVAGKQAAAAGASAKGADESAKMALDAKQAVAEHRTHVDEVTADLDAAIAGAAAGIVTDRIVSDAVDAATATATDAAGRAEQSSTAAGVSAAAAQAEAERATTAASQADGAALRAAEFAGKLEHEFNAETSVARMATELVTLSDRFTKSALAGLQNELTTAQTQGQFAQLSDRVTCMEMRAAGGN